MSLNASEPSSSGGPPSPTATHAPSETSSLSESPTLPQPSVTATPTVCPAPSGTSPLVSQVSTQTNTQYLSHQVGIRRDPHGRVEFLWQVPASHHRHNSQQASNMHVRNSPSNQLHQQRQERSDPPPAQPSAPDEANGVPSLESSPEVLPMDKPSTSSSTNIKDNDKPSQFQSKLSESSSTDSEAEGMVRHLRKKNKLRLSTGTTNGKHDGKKINDIMQPCSSKSGLSESPPSRSNSSARSKGCAGQPLKRKGNEDSFKTPTKLKLAADSSSSSDSDSPMPDKINRKNLTKKRKVRRCLNEETTLETSESTSTESIREVNGAAQSRENHSSQQNQSCECSSRHEVPPLQHLPEPTFTRQLEAITGRLDYLMFLQRNALDPALRGRNGAAQDSSALRNSGDSSNASEENSGPSDAVNITTRLLIRLTESLSRQIQMVQQVRRQQSNCSEHQPPQMNQGSQPNLGLLNVIRRRGQELLSLMADSLSTFSAQNTQEDYQGNAALNHVQSMTAAFWLLQGLYILLHLALELTDILLTHFISSYESNDPEDESVTAPIPQPCVCLNSNASSTPSLASRTPGRPASWNSPPRQPGSANSRPFGTVNMQHPVFETLRPRPPRPAFLDNVNVNVTQTNNTTELTSPPTPTSPSSASVRRPLFVLGSAPVRPPVQSPVGPRRNETPSLVQIPVVPVPSYTPQVNSNEATESRGLQLAQPAPSSYALVHPVTQPGAIRRNNFQSPRVASHQHFQQPENNTQSQGPFPPYVWPGIMRLRSRLLLPPPSQQQERASLSSDADAAAQQSLYFHFDYTRNIGHFVREPSFTIEEHRIHRIQLWNFSKGDIPDISDGDENLVVGECKIHNDASVDISADGCLLVALLPAPRPAAHSYVTSAPPGQTVGVYSLVWESLGQLLYTTSLDQPAVSVALSPTAAFLLVGLATRRAMLVPSDQHAFAQIFKLEGAKPGRPIGARGRLNLHRYIEAQNDHVSVGINCIRWAPVSGQGIVYGTNTGALVMLR